MTSIYSSNLAPGGALDLQSLRNRLSGDIIVPGDAGYEAARRVSNLGFDRHPWTIVRALTAADVVQAVRFARLHRLPLAVRGGGHSVAGHSTADGAVVVDLSGMRAVSIDPGNHTARVQAGGRSIDLAGPAHAYGLALSTGDTATVGIGGLTLAGGIGWMVRKYGLAIDNLIEAQVVTADGRLITTNAKQHSELFWAIRGGGGNFGIITEYTFRLAPVGAVYGGAIVLPATPEVVRGYLQIAKEAPDELSTIAQVMHAPPAPFIPEERLGELVFMVMVCFTGDAEAGERAIAPFRALAEPVAEMVGEMPYPAMFNLTEAAAQPHAAEVRSFFTDDLPGDGIESIIDAVGKATSPMSMVQLRVLGGAVRHVADGETAYAHRDRDYFVAVLGLWLDPSEDGAPHRAWTQAAWDSIKQYRQGVYVNFLADEGEDRIHEAYPAATYERLAQVKAQYDPENIFQFNQNIRPAVRQV